MIAVLLKELPEVTHVAHATVPVVVEITNGLLATTAGVPDKFPAVHVIALPNVAGVVRASDPVAVSLITSEPVAVP